MVHAHTPIPSAKARCMIKTEVNRRKKYILPTSKEGKDGCVEATNNWNRWDSPIQAEWGQSPTDTLILHISPIFMVWPLWISILYFSSLLESDYDFFLLWKLIKRNVTKMESGGWIRGALGPYYLSSDRPCTWTLLYYPSRRKKGFPPNLATAQPMRIHYT